MSEIAEQVHHIPLTDINADSDFNCRMELKAVDVLELASSIKEEGLLQPVVVQEQEPDIQKETGCKYLLLMGYRRYMAHKVNLATTIKTIIRSEKVDVQRALILNLTENMQREDLNIMEEAISIEKIDPPINGKHQYGEHDLAKKINSSRGWVQIRRMFRKLPLEIQEEVVAFKIPQSKVRDMYTVYKATNFSEDALYEAFRKIKDAKHNGTNVNVQARNTNLKRIRTKSEIQALIGQLVEEYGTCLAAKCLAWASGELSDAEFVYFMQENEMSDYTPPWTDLK